MVNERTIFEKYRSERSNDLALAVYITRHSASAVLYDIRLERRFARCVQFGVNISTDNALACIGGIVLRVMRESGTPGNAVKKLGFAAPADVTMIIEETLTPTDLFLPPDVEMAVLPMLSAAMGGDFTAVLAAAMQQEGSVIAADVTGGFRAAAYVDGRLKTVNYPMKGGLDGCGLESGMPLESGAIDELSREPDGTLCYSVIGDGDSMGISAPAAAGAVKLMLDGGIIDSDGIMTDRDLFYIGEDFYISQQDVRAVQSDVAVCRAALQLFGREAGRTDRFIMSGEAFGSQRGAALMAQLGAVPEGLAARYGWNRLPGEQGVISWLTDPALSDRIDLICSAAEDISAELSGEFNELYIKNLGF
ncbi:MAG: ASKHA domain-containing protein [Oscillospiraceae bacterium]